MSVDDLAYKRVRELREHLGLGRGAFEKETGIERRTIENIELGRQKVYLWHIQRIGERWPEFRYWLAFGEAMPEAGQISPEIERLREDSTAEGAG